MVRKIDGAKWNRFDESKGTEAVPADLITKDLKTNKNTLSLWLADSESCIEDVILALVSSYKSIDTIDIIKINRKFIDEKELSLKQTKGSTAYSIYINNHYDLIDLTYKSLGCFVKLILENKATIERKRAPYIKSILKDGIDKKKIAIEDLDPHIVESLNLQNSQYT
jgi:hypothetical protein